MEDKQIKVKQDKPEQEENQNKGDNQSKGDKPDKGEKPDKGDNTNKGEHEEKEKEGEGEGEEEKPRWIDLFDREAHRRCQMEHMRDKEYEDIVATLRRSQTKRDEAEDSLAPFHIPIPAETYFLSPDPFQELALGGRGSRSSGSYSSSQSESSFSMSTVSTSAPASSRKFLPPEVVERKRKSRRRRTAVYVCVGVLGLALVALAVGVILHFLLESGSIGGKGKEESSQE